MSKGKSGTKRRLETECKVKMADRLRPRGVIRGLMGWPGQVTLNEQ